MALNEETGEVKDDRTTVEEGGGNIKADVTTFEELLQEAGIRGRWTWLMFVMCSFSGFVTPMSAVSYQFLGATPDHWCHVGPLVEANWTTEQILALAIPLSNVTARPEGCLVRDYNYREAARRGYEAALADPAALGPGDPVPCFVRDFNLSTHHTIVTEWDLVCERRPLYSTTQAVNQLGTLIGSVTYSHLCDVLGRRKTVLLSSVLSISTSFLTATAFNVECYIFFRVLFQAVDFGVYLGCLIVAMELCSPAQRNVVGCLYLLPWALGYMLVPAIAYVVRPWRWLQVAYTVPVFYTLIYFPYLPESPRWSILKGRNEEALKTLQWAARVNGRKLPSHQSLLAAMDNIRKKERVKREREAGTSLVAKLSEIVNYLFMLVLTPVVRVRAFIVFYLWIAIAMVYYGLSLNSTNLQVDLYLYSFLSGLLEIPAYLFLWLLAASALGRRQTLALLLLTCALTTAVLFSFMFQAVLVGDVVKMTVSLIGKMAITAAFQLVFIYTSEMFSTRYRARALGEASMYSRLGSSLSPYINDILGDVVEWGPSVLFSVMALAGSALVLLLPETVNKKLPQADQRLDDHHAPPAASSALSPAPPASRPATVEEWCKTLRFGAAVEGSSTPWDVGSYMASIAA